MWTLLRRFGDLAVPTSPAVRQLVAAIRQPPRLPADLPIHERVSAIQDLQMPTQLRIKELSNEQLVMAIRTYSLSGQGSPEFYSKAALQAMKRLHSLQSSQLASLCYSFTRARTASPRLFASVEHSFLRDISKFSPLEIARLAYAFVSSGSQTFYQTAAEVFKANSASFSTEAGLLLLVALEKRKWTADSLGEVLQQWAKSVAGAQDLLAQVYHVLQKLKADESTLLPVEQALNPSIMSLRCLEQLLGCCATFSRKLAPALLAEVPLRLVKPPVDTVAIAHLIHTVRLVPEHDFALEAIHVYLQKNLVMLSPGEVSRIGSAVLETKDADANTRQILSALFTSLKFEATDLLRLLLAAGTDKVAAAALISQLAELAPMLTPREFVLAVTLLARLEITSPDVWRPLLNAAQELSLEDAEQYIQVYSVLHSLKEVDTSAALQKLTNKYEA